MKKEMDHCALQKRIVLATSLTDENRSQHAFRYRAGHQEMQMLLSNLDQSK